MSPVVTTAGCTAMGDADQLVPRHLYDRRAAGAVALHHHARACRPSRPPGHLEQAPSNIRREPTHFLQDEWRLLSFPAPLNLSIVKLHPTPRSRTLCAQNVHALCVRPTSYIPSALLYCFTYHCWPMRKHSKTMASFSRRGLQ